jgi:hypothetical protein
MTLSLWQLCVIVALASFAGRLLWDVLVWWWQR